jgi:hypothetical protein
MKSAFQPELLVSVGDLSVLDAGAVIIEIEYPFDEAFGDPAIHYFQVVAREGARVIVAGIPKELIPGTEEELDFRLRVRPVKDAFVRACGICRKSDIDDGGQTGEERMSFSAINDARWFAFEGTGPLHDESSSAFDHAFADYVPTATIAVHFEDGEPYLTPQRASTILCLDFPSNDLWRLGHS